MLHHVSLEVPGADATRSAAFWTALGFVRVHAPPEIADRVTWFEREGTQIHLIRTATAIVPPVGHTAVVAPDLDDAVDRLRAAGFEVEPKRRLWGAARALAIAPGGHRVELMSAAPPAGR